MMPNSSLHHQLEEDENNLPSSLFSISEEAVPFETAQCQERVLFKNGALPISEPGCFIWSMPQGLVVPKSARTNPDFETAQKTMADLGWPVHIRQTGGDLTPQAPGMINISYVFAQTWSDAISIDATYKALCAPIISYLKQKHNIDAYCSAVDGAFCDGKFNIVVEGQKIAGTAQKWRHFKNDKGQKCIAVLGHIALLGDVPLDQMINAANQFYQQANVDKIIQLANHTTLFHLIGEQNYNQSELMQGLLQSFREAAPSCIGTSP